MFWNFTKKRVIWTRSSLAWAILKRTLLKIFKETSKSMNKYKHINIHRTNCKHYLTSTSIIFTWSTWRRGGGSQGARSSSGFSSRRSRSSQSGQRHLRKGVSIIINYGWHDVKQKMFTLPLIPLLAVLNDLAVGNSLIFGIWKGILAIKVIRFILTHGYLRKKNYIRICHLTFNVSLQELIRWKIWIFIISNDQ